MEHGDPWLFFRELVGETTGPIWGVIVNDQNLHAVHTKKRSLGVHHLEYTFSETTEILDLVIRRNDDQELQQILSLVLGSSDPALSRTESRLR